MKASSFPVLCRILATLWIIPAVTRASDILYVGAQTITVPIYTYDSAGNQTFFANPAGLLTRQMTADAAGNVYVTYQASGEIDRYSPSGVATPVVTGILSAPYGLALDGSGNLYYSDRTDDEIIRVAPGGASTLFANAAAPGAALAFH